MPSICCTFFQSWFGIFYVQMFFELDRDGSGSIDAEELGMMLRSLGQNPTDEEIKELIASVDDEDGDGQLQLREFLQLYTQGLDSKTKGKRRARTTSRTSSQLWAATRWMRPAL